jgi:predicted O-methyltransferase YrrM
MDDSFSLGRDSPHLRINDLGRLVKSASNEGRSKGLSSMISTGGQFFADIISDRAAPLGKARARCAIQAMIQTRSLDNNLDSHIDQAFSFDAAGTRIRPLQVKSEIKGLLTILSGIKLGTLMEIGTDGGGTLFLFSAIADKRARIVSLDLHGFANWKAPFYESFAREEQKLDLVRADSHNPSTLRHVEKLLLGHELDFLFIDGDHTYEGVKKDFQMYHHLVRNGGAIAFHDIVHHPASAGCEVEIFWNEIKQKYEFKEIVQNYSQGWGGIGVLYV